MSVGFVSFNGLEFCMNYLMIFWYLTFEFSINRWWNIDTVNTETVFCYFLYCLVGTTEFDILLMVNIGIIDTNQTILFN